MRTDLVVYIIYLLLAPVADELMKLGCQGDTGVTQVVTQESKNQFST